MEKRKTISGIMLFIIVLTIMSIPAIAAGQRKINVLSEYTVKRDWGEKKYTFTYNSSGLVEKAQITSHSFIGETLDILTCYYDKKGNLIKEIWSNGTEITEKYTYEYKAGKLVKEKRHIGEDAVTTYKWNGRTYTGRSDDGDGTQSTISGKYDKKGRLIYESIKNDGEKKKTFWTYQYDKKGYLKKVGGNAYKETYKNTYKGSQLTQSAIVKGPIKSTAAFTYQKINIPQASLKKAKEQQSSILINWDKGWF